MALCLAAVSLCAALYLASAENATNEMTFRYVDNNEIVNLTDCETTACITKCCPKNQILEKFADYNYTCIENDKFNVNRTYKLDYSDVEVYEKNIREKIVKSSKKMSNITQIYSESYTSDNTLMDTLKNFAPPGNEIYLLENGKLTIRRLNYYKQWFLQVATDNFCVDYQIEKNGTVSKTPTVVTLMIIEDSENKPISKNTITAYVLLVSCFFLFLVLAVYAVLPQLRNLAGMMLMAYVATFIAAIILRAGLVLGTDYGTFSQKLCLYLGITGFYTIIASYTWINVMSFDIWWTMRGFRKSRQLQRSSILIKFGWYSLYGWGAPLLLLLFSIIVDNLDLWHLPNFVKPHFSNDKCFIQEEERQLYMNGPILITTCINIALFLMTTYNIWRIKTGVSKHSAGESRKNQNDEIRFGIYLKLSLVMGVFWIMEVVGTLYHTDSLWWYIPDIFNCLIGVFIFIIFVCKRNIIVLLLKRFSVGEELVQKLQTYDSTRTTRE